MRACVDSDDSGFRQQVLQQLTGLVGPMDHAALNLLIPYSISKDRPQQGLRVLRVSDPMRHTCCNDAALRHTYSCGLHDKSHVFCQMDLSNIQQAIFLCHVTGFVTAHACML